MRQASPISPALQLGAERVLVVGAGQLGKPGVLQHVDPAAYPSLAQIAGHALASIFLDALASDIERLERLNRIAEEMTVAQRRTLNLRLVSSLVISPSQRLDGIAAQHKRCLPRPLRALPEGLGAAHGNGAALASYLMFEAPFTRVLIDLGFDDTMSRRQAVIDFLTEPRESESAHEPKVVVV